MMIAAVHGQPAPKYDPRYSHKYKYRYDERGNLIEEMMHMSNGSIWQRTVRKFNGNQMEELIYDENGALNQKSRYTFDERGNKVEEIMFDPQDGSVKNRYSYAHEFDSTGNWIKQTTSEWVTKNGRSFFEPTGITYRTIVYY
ncbi:MAG: hypothetical protein AUG51_13270 [Acidobacteria bacterium 13_1_20CM_3_53_8]|nr:MAG: hypothetical protein AUG51_13270 [Acidobacteria bacterium 13_1_20CM_3_53_8]